MEPNRIKVYVADRDITGARALADSLNASSDGQIVWPVEVDVADWDSQRRAFEAAVSEFKRIDYVLPIAGIGERRSFPHPKPGSTGFEKPDLSVMEIDGIGPIYTVSLAVQHFRRQGLNKYGFRGKSMLCHYYQFMFFGTNMAPPQQLWQWRLSAGFTSTRRFQSTRLRNSKFPPKGSHSLRSETPFGKKRKR